MRETICIGAVGVLFAVGCGPRVLLDEGGGEASAAGGEVGGTSDGAGDDQGSDPPSPPTGTTDGSPESSGGLDESSSGDAAVEPNDCYDIATEAVVCATLAGGGVQLIGGETGRVCELVALTEPVTATSLAWDGDKVLLCDPGSNGMGELGLVLDDGSVADLDIDCEAVANYGDGVLLMPWWSPDETYLYPTLDALSDDVPERVVQWHPHTTSVAATPEHLYSATYFSEFIEVTTLDEPMESSELDLQHYDGRIWGLSVVDDYVFVIAGPDATLLGRFEVDTGAHQGIFALSTEASLTGLACRRP